MSLCGREARHFCLGRGPIVAEAIVDLPAARVAMRIMGSGVCDKVFMAGAGGLRSGGTAMRSGFTLVAMMLATTTCDG